MNALASGFGMAWVVDFDGHFFHSGPESTGRLLQVAVVCVHIICRPQIGTRWTVPLLECVHSELERISVLVPFM